MRNDDVPSVGASAAASAALRTDDIDDLASLSSISTMTASRPSILFIPKERSPNNKYAPARSLGGVTVDSAEATRRLLELNYDQVRLENYFNIIDAPVIFVYK